MITVEVPIKDPKNPPALKFPDRCVNCGKPKHVVLPIKLAMGVEKRGQGVLMDLPVPLCAECERRERRVTNVTLVPFVVAGFLIGAIAFVPALLISPEGTTPDTAGFPFVFGGFVGLIAGIIGGTVVEFLLKFLFAPAYGQLLLKRPLTVLSFFNDSENVIGLSARFTDKKKSLKLTFENDDIAKEFKGLNS
jgi:hypothetical protein